MRTLGSVSPSESAPDGAVGFRFFAAPAHFGRFLHAGARHDPCATDQNLADQRFFGRWCRERRNFEKFGHVLLTVAVAVGLGTNGFPTPKTRAERPQKSAVSAIPISATVLDYIRRAATTLVSGGVNVLSQKGTPRYSRRAVAKPVWRSQCPSHYYP